MSGKKSWYIVDGYRPPEEKGGADDYMGHESIMILNCNDKDAHVQIDIYFADREPIKGISYLAPARRISAFRTNDNAVFQNAKLEVGVQYSLNITSDVGVVVQYGRLDINQDNMSYMAMIGHTE